MVGINNTTVLKSNSVSQYWTQQIIDASCLFYASDNTDLLNKVAATHLPNQVTGAVDFLTVTGTGLNARYRTPDNSTYRTADSDYVFWKSDASESTCDGNRLIAWDFPRILVKYGNTAPYTILAIAILKPGVTVTNGMFTAFQLSELWSGVINAYGVIKGNRLGQGVWTPESVWESESAALFARMTALSETPTGARQTIINNAIKADKTNCGFTSMYDCLYLLASHGIASAKLNIIKNSSNCVNIGSPSFTTDTGIKGNGTDAGLDCNYTANSDAIKFLQDAHAFGVYINQYAQAANVQFNMGGSGTNICRIYTGAGGDLRVNSLTASTAYLGGGDNGMWIVVRVNSTTIKVYHNGTQLGSDVTQSSNAIGTLWAAIGQNFYKGHPDWGGQFSSANWLLSFIGGYMTAQNVADFQTNWVSGYLHNIGAI